MRPRSRPRLALRGLVALLLVVAAAGCGGGGPGRGGGAPAGTLRVFAAASLTEAFTEMGRVFEGLHPGVEVTFTFAASSALATQIIEGGPADVFASADPSTMQQVVDAGGATDPAVIARNRLALLVEKGNPKGITGLADLARPGVVFVLCAPEVPCGRFGAAALAGAGVAARPASLEENVKAVVSRVTLGEADAGIVYATDVKAAGARARGVAIGVAADPSFEAAYPMAVTTPSRHRPAARAWVDYVLSPAGRSTLAGLGFLAP